MNKPTSRRPKPSVLKAHGAFSLIELLVVIAVIGIIAAIAIPNIANLTGGATTAKNQRNAQNIASVYSAAVAAGATNTTAPADTAAAINEITETSPGLTNAAGASFFIPNMADADREAAEVYLNYTNGQLVYDPAATP